MFRTYTEIVYIVVRVAFAAGAVAFIGFALYFSCSISLSDTSIFDWMDVAGALIMAALSAGGIFAVSVVERVHRKFLNR